jgi:murein DD-endopeptidase MepM/ murein hydrolase activator NlpD
MDIDQYIGTNNIKAVPISKPLSGSSVGNSSKGDSAKGGGGNSNPFGWLSDIWSWFSKGAGAIYNQVLGSIGQKMPNLPGGAFQQEMTGVGGLIGNTVKTWLGNVMATVTPPSVGGGNMGYTGTFNPNAKLVTAGASQIIPNADATYGFYGENIIGGAHGWHGWMTDSTLAHAGMDFTSPHGTPVHEFIGGTVEEAANTAWGGEVGVDIGHGMHERYLHLIDMAVKVGQFIKRGTLLGHSGGDTVATGLGTWSNGAHLHYEVDGGIAAGQGGRGQNWYPPSVWNAFGLKNPFDFSPAGLGGGNTSSTPVSSPGGGAKGNWGAIVDWLHSTVDPLPYVWGGGGPNGYDCSGLAGEVWNRVTGHPSYHRVMRAGQGAAYYDGPGINVDGWPGYNMKPGLTNNGFNIAVTSGHMWGQIAGCGFEAANPNMGILIGNQATGMNTGAAHYTYTGMANGGIINEKILGVGASGKRYAFGESGPERIIPNTTSNGGNARGGSCNCDELADKIVSAMKGMSIKMDGNKVGQVVIDAARLRGLKI